VEVNRVILLFLPIENRIMDLFTIIALSFGLSFDTFAVSLSCGIIKSRIGFIEALKVAFIMAVFQGGLAVAGYFMGSIVSGSVKAIDHWLAFLLLGFLGVKMILEGLSRDEECEPRDITKIRTVLTMALATSIDAFAVGISLALLEVFIWTTAGIIGVVTFLASMIAIRIGKAAGKRLGNRIEIIGGAVLIMIGIKIVIEHLMV
jgi:putative Mn2+ efflux pump MntP